MADSLEIKTMRMMEWEKIKGSIRAILHTYWGDDLASTEYNKLDDIARKFVDEFSEKGKLG